METLSVEAIVIGAGMAGATAAAHLSATRRVVLLEAEESAGYHTTGRSAAIWIRNYGSPDVRILTAASRGFFDAPPQAFADAPLIRPRDVVHLAPPGQVEHLRQMMAGAPDMRPLDLDALRARVPVLRPGYAVLAALEPDCFDMDVAALHQGYLRQAVARGGTLALRQSCRADLEAGRAVAGGSLERRRLRRPGAGRCRRRLGRRGGGAGRRRVLGLQPKRRTACIIDPGAHDCADWPLLGDVDHTWYVRPEARRKLMVSPADETDERAARRPAGGAGRGDRHRPHAAGAGYPGRPDRA